MNAFLLIVLVGVEYPALPSTVECVGFVGCIPALKGEVLSLNNKTVRCDGGRHRVGASGDVA